MSALECKLTQALKFNPYHDEKGRFTSAAFKTWFGDSKVVDDTGKPLVVYHGTTKPQDFEAFENSGSGIFFASYPWMVGDYAAGRGREDRPRIIPVYLKIENPLIVDSEDPEIKPWIRQREKDMPVHVDTVRARGIALAKQQGRDGVIFRNFSDEAYYRPFPDEGDIYVVFEPTQIKSAIGNVGLYDPKDARITKFNPYHDVRGRFASHGESGGGWTQVGPQGGSNPGGVFADPHGVKHYVKFPQHDPDQAKAEHLADLIYGALDIPVKESQVITHEGRLGIAGKMLEGVSSPGYAELSRSPDVQQGFVADAYLANWDVPMRGNILQSGDRGVRVDSGGVLFYRAQGREKDFPADRVDELESLRAPGRVGEKVFRSLTPAQIQTQAQQLVARLPDHKLVKLIYKAGFSDQVALKYLNTLVGRRNVIAQRYGIKIALECSTILKFNPYHDEKGRFASSNAAGGVGVESAAFKKWFKNSKVVDSDGEPLKVYHGTTHDLEEFLPAGDQKLNPESDWGAAAYFTNSPEDMNANYSGEGPDLTNRLEQRAEQIENEKAYPPDGEGDPVEITHEEALALARKELVGKAGALSIPVYLSLQNPYVLGKDEYSDLKETMLTYEMEKLDPEDEDSDYADPTGTLVDFTEALRHESAKYQETEGIEEVIQEIYQEAEFDSMSASRLDALLRKSERFSYVTDDNGVLVGHELYRQALEAVGFDGIIDRTVDQKFGSQSPYKQMVGMDQDTLHYVVFKPEQIKSAIGNTTWDPKDKRITKAQVLKYNPYHDLKGRFTSASQDGGSGTGGDDIPVAPGSTPIPPGMIRAYHYTRTDDGLPSILKHGISTDFARGNTYGEPNVIWASTDKPGDFKHYVEILVKPEEIGIGAMHSHIQDAQGNWVRADTPELHQKNIDEFNARGSNFALNIPRLTPDRIVTYSEPWIAQYHSLVGAAEDRENPQRAKSYEGMLGDIVNGGSDALLDDPVYAKVIGAIKRKFSHLKTPAASALKYNPYHDKEGKFTSRGSSHTYIPGQGMVRSVQEPDGGFTYHAVTGDSPRTGFAVSIYKDREQVMPASEVTVDRLATFTKQNADLLRQTNNYLGAWHNPENGQVYLDISIHVHDEGQAAFLGRRANQSAYFDLSRGHSVVIKSESRSHVKKAAHALYHGILRWSAHLGGFDRPRTVGDRQRTHPGGNRAGESYSRIFKGGVGSGHHGHKGRPGERGGSAEGFATVVPTTTAGAKAMIRAASGVQQIGVSPHPHAYQAAVVVANTLEEMKAKGYHMPNQVDIAMVQGEDNLSGATQWQGSPATAEEEARRASSILSIYLPEGPPDDMPLDDIVAKVYHGTATKGYVDGVGVRHSDETHEKFTEKTFREVVIHEMAHVQSVGGVTAAVQELLDTQSLPWELVQKGALDVSWYALKHPEEFVAEAFVKQYRGETLTADSAKLYALLKGPQIR